ncbi:MAG: hypothetical protein ACYSTJ_06000 [Planctomycetota bacterium]
MKQCGKCKKWKNESKFGKSASLKDGLTRWCKSCISDFHRRKYRKKKGRHVRRYLNYEQRHRVVGGVKEKSCCKCGKWKAESEYYKMRRHKDGLAARCKKCSDKATNEARRRRSAARN